jgi:hypothetical protein
LSPLTLGGFLFVLAAYGVWLTLVMKRPQALTSLSASMPPASGAHTAQAAGE